MNENILAVPPFSWSVSQTSTTDTSLSFVFHFPFTHPSVPAITRFSFCPQINCSHFILNWFANCHHWCISAAISPPHLPVFISLQLVPTVLRCSLLASVQRRGWHCWVSQSFWWSTAGIAALPQHWCYAINSLLHFTFYAIKLYLHPYSTLHFSRYTDSINRGEHIQSNPVLEILIQPVQVDRKSVV